MERVSKKEAAEAGMPEELRREMLKSMFDPSNSKTNFPLHAKLMLTLLARGVGILSLSETPCNLLMWAHYAQSHEGFVIGFRTKSPFLSRRDARPGAMHDLRRVQYSKRRPILRYFTRLDIARLYFTKSKEWSYEREWRLYTSMPREHTYELMIEMLYHIAHPHELSAVPACKIQLFDFPPSCVESIILGCRATTETEHRVKEFVLNRYPHAVLLRARQSRRKFELEFERLG
jgi:hypothetical protein